MTNIIFVGLTIFMATCQPNLGKDSFVFIEFLDFGNEFLGSLNVNDKIVFERKQLNNADTVRGTVLVVLVTGVHNSEAERFRLYKATDIYLVAFPEQTILNIKLVVDTVKTNVKIDPSNGAYLYFAMNKGDVIVLQHESPIKID